MAATLAYPEMQGSATHLDSTGDSAAPITMTLMATSPHLRELPVRTRLKLAASVLLAVPVAALLLLAVGEMVGGDLSGAMHFVEAAPLALLLAAAWRYPRAAGIVLLGLGPLLLAIWLVLVATAGPRGVEILGWAATGFVLFILPLAAGWLLWRAGCSSR